MLLDELSTAGRSMLAIAARIGADVARPAAQDVDDQSRFPSEAIAALRSEGMLGALVPTQYGGMGCTYTDLSVVCTELGKHCGNTAMVYAMHQIQVACIVQHCQGVEHFDHLLRDIAGPGRLMASATTEAGIGGDVRSSICAVEYDGDKIRVEKQASVISYGDYVDDVLVTARRDADAPASEQVIVHAQRPDLDLEPDGSTWDVIGMRGTCSTGYLLRATGVRDQIVPMPYSQLSAMTMLPVTHITWASLWLGIAEDAVRTARAYVRKAARKTPGVIPPNAVHLAEVYGQLERSRALLERCVHEYERVVGDVAATTSMGFTVRMNNLKAMMSQDVLEIVQRCLFICGISGFRNDTQYSLGRHLRDATSAQLMVHNDRITHHNASLLCAMKDD